MSWMSKSNAFQAVVKVLKKCIACIKERRLPKVIQKIIYIYGCRIKTLLYNMYCLREHKQSKYKCLYASPVGKEGKKFLEKIIQRFDHENFEYLIFVYDDTKFDEQIFDKCSFIYEKGLRWQFIKKYVTPEYCKNYDYIFLWADDIDIENFSYKNFIEIMKRNNLENAQPALTHKSYYSFEITLQNKNYKIGRYTDIVEIMIPVFRRETWTKYWNMIETEYNPWGWGYGMFGKSICGFTNVGIIDCEPVTHTKELRKTSHETLNDYEKFKKKNNKKGNVPMIAYGKLK